MNLTLDEAKAIADQFMLKHLRSSSGILSVTLTLDDAEQHYCLRVTVIDEDSKAKLPADYKTLTVLGLVNPNESSPVSTSQDSSLPATVGFLDEVLPWDCDPIFTAQMMGPQYPGQTTFRDNIINVRSSEAPDVLSIDVFDMLVTVVRSDATDDASVDLAGQVLYVEGKDAQSS
jgi:hypothetical protein